MSTKAANPIADPDAHNAPMFTGALKTLAPSWGQIWDRTKSIAPPALMVGAGGASLLQLIKMFRDQRQAQEAGKPRKDVLTIELPAPKQASILSPEVQAKVDGLWNAGRDKINGIGEAITKPYMQAGQQQVDDPSKTPHLFSENAMRLAIALGAVSAGAYGMNKFFDSRRKSDLENRLQKAKDEYSTILGQSLMGGPAPIKTASGVPFEIHGEACPTVAGLCQIVAEMSFPEHKTAAGEARGNVLTEAVGVPMTLLTLSGILSHKWLYNRLKEQEKVESAAIPAPPREIRLVTKPQGTTGQPAANESDIVTPEEADPRKAASSKATLYDADQFPVEVPAEAVQDPITLGDAFGGAKRKVRNNFFRNLAMGGAVGLGAGASSLFRRGTGNMGAGEIATELAIPTVAGTALGGLIGGTLDAGTGFFNNDLARLERMKGASALDGVLDGMGIGQIPSPAAAVTSSAVSAVAAGPDPKAAPNPEHRETAPVKIVDVGPGTVAAQTSGGPVTIEAEDANAARVLQANKGRLKRVLSVLQAQEVQAV